MKKAIYIISIVLLGILITTWYSCETDPEETCELDEICPAKFVTACCTEYDCVYKYGGKEYTEDQLDQLEADLGCGASAVLKSGCQECETSDVIVRLKALMDRAKKHCKACK